MKITINPEAAETFPKEHQFGSVAFTSFATILELFKAHGLIKGEVDGIQIERNGIVLHYKS